MTGRTLVLGGARSGKSAHAEGLVPAGASATYVATAQRDPADPEWCARIASHVARRPGSWHTVEAGAPDELDGILRSAGELDPPLLVDDLATWLTGVLDHARAWERDPSALDVVAQRCDDVLGAVRDCDAPVILVSAEVGLGVVPETRSGRLFRDELGALNARLAEVCDEVVLLVAGVPMRLR